MLDLYDRVVNAQYYAQSNDRVPGYQIETMGPARVDTRQYEIAKTVLGSGATSVIDLGAADGSLLFALAWTRQITKAHGVDLWEDGVRWGNWYAKKTGLPVTLEVGNIIDYVPDMVFDWGILGETVEHVTDPEKAIQTLARSSRRQIITVPVERPPLSPTELKRLETCPEEHINQIDLQSLEVLAMSAGLIITKASYIGRGWVSLVAICEHRGGPDEAVE